VLDVTGVVILNFTAMITAKRWLKDWSMRLAAVQLVEAIKLAHYWQVDFPMLVKFGTLV
jgi:hypothetical protein